MLGRLYDGIECQGLARALVEVVRREAGVPVYDDLASERHPTAQLVEIIGADERSAKLRELVVQVVLLSTIA
jgi:ornithine carbamoyltransferase